MSVKYGILTLLSIHQNHGYDLKIELESLLGANVKINAGQIYTTLDRLIRDELVRLVGEDDQERKIYTIEPKGVIELTKWLLEPVPYVSTRDSFHFKWSCARKIKFDHEEKMLNQQKLVIMQDVM